MVSVETTSAFLNTVCLNRVLEDDKSIGDHWIHVKTA